MRRRQRWIDTTSARVELLERRQLLSVGPVGPETQINTFTTDNQGRVALAMDATGNYVAVWESFGQDGSDFGIYARRYNAAGAGQGAEFRVNTYTTGTQDSPSVAMNANGDFVITWVSFTQDGDGQGVYARRYNAAGAGQGAEFRVNTYTTKDQSVPKAAIDSAGDFVITWQSYSQDGGSNGIYARRYNSAGAGQGAEFLVNTYTSTGQYSPDVAMSSAGAFVITWQSYKQDGSGYGVYAQRYNSSGVRQGSEYRVNTYTKLNQKSSAIAMDSVGDFVIAWQTNGQDGDGYAVYARRYNAAGAGQGPEFKVNTYTTGHQEFPAIAMDSLGNFVVTWESSVQESGEGIYAQRYNSADVAQGTEFHVNTYTTGDQNFPDIAMDASGDFVIAWSGLKLAGANYDVYAQRYQINHPPTGTSGTVTGLENTPLVLTAANFGFFDPNDTPANTLLAVKITLLPSPSAGQLTDNGVAVTANQFVTVADINAGKLVFKPKMLLSGGPFFLCKFQVEDNGGGGTGENLDPTAKVLNVKITHVNQAPTGADHTVSMTKNTTYVFKVSDFGFSDSGDNPPNALLAVKITTLPLLGSLTDNGVVVAAGAHVTVVDITNGKLKYTPKANGTGSPYAGFTFQVQDNGGTANAGVDTDPSAQKMTLSVS